jgi:hypothetical protein
VRILLKKALILISIGLIAVFLVYLRFASLSELSIIESLVGFNSNQIYVLKTTYKIGNLGNHNLLNQKIVVYELIGKTLKEIKNDDITNNDSLSTIVGFESAIPDFIGRKHLNIVNSKEDSIFYYGKEYKVKNIIPSDYSDYSIESLEQIYSCNKRLFLVVNLEDKTIKVKIRKIVFLDVQS